MESVKKRVFVLVVIAWKELGAFRSVWRLDWLG